MAQASFLQSVKVHDPDGAPLMKMSLSWKHIKRKDAIVNPKEPYHLGGEAEQASIEQEGLSSSDTACACAVAAQPFKKLLVA